VEQLPEFQAADLDGQPLTHVDVLAAAPVLVVLLRGFA
jgi:hypothetical protein